MESIRQYFKRTDKIYLLLCIFSSAMAVVGFLMGVISTNRLLGQLGTFLGVGSLVSLAIVLSALPGFLYLADPLIIKRKKQPKEA